MPAEGVELSPDSHIMTREQIMRLATIFSGVGVEKVRLTGGEPFVRKDLVNIVGDMGKLFKHVGITTNGNFPRKLERL